MSWMLKHKDYGIYQGSCMGLGFWHPMSDMPEQGLCEFKELADAVEYQSFLCSKECSVPLLLADLEILPFDSKFNIKLQEANK